MDTETEKIPKDSSIYHYKLLKRIHYKREYLMLYVSALLILGMASTYFAGFIQWLTIFSGFLILHVIYTVIISVLLQLDGKTIMQEWSFQLYMPWIGILPKQHMDAGQLYSIHLHLLWVGIAIIGCVTPWLPAATIITLLLLHLWILIPRFVLLSLGKENKKALIKINKDNTSFYQA